MQFHFLFRTVKTAGPHLIPIKSYSKNTHPSSFLKWIIVCFFLINLCNSKNEPNIPIFIQLDSKLTQLSFGLYYSNSKFSGQHFFQIVPIPNVSSVPSRRTRALIYYHLIIYRIIHISVLGAKVTFAVII